MSNVFNEIIKTTSTPVIVRFSGVDFPSQDDVVVKIGTETYQSSTQPTNVVVDANDKTKLEVVIGTVTALDVGKYQLQITIVNSTYPSGLVLSDCITNILEVQVRDVC